MALTDAPGWTLLALVGVLLSVIGGLVVNQFHLLRGYLDARFTGPEARSTPASRDWRAPPTPRFDGVTQRLEHLDRDVQALTRDRFGRDRPTARSPRPLPGRQPTAGSRTFAGIVGAGRADQKERVVVLGACGAAELEHVLSLTDLAGNPFDRDQYLIFISDA